jgi:biopolymer transport protein ExbB
MNLLAIVSKGGWLMIPIYICFVVGLVIVIERFLTLRKAKIDTGLFVTRIKTILLKKDVNGALRLCEKTPGPISSLIRVGIKKHDKSRDEIKEAIETAGKLEIYHLERYLGVLATVAGVSPLLGFLGTVTGMIKAFMKIQALGGNVNASVLAGGIWEALVTTAAGLAVGIPSLILYNFLIGKVEKMVFEMQSISTDLLDFLVEERSRDELQD